jgi:hypothetical protein
MNMDIDACVIRNNCSSGKSEMNTLEVGEDKLRITYPAPGVSIRKTRLDNGAEYSKLVVEYG